MESSQAIEAEFTNGRCVLTYESLDASDVIRQAQSDLAGATAVFIGTTRDNFQGKKVTRLEYQAYSKLAIKTMQSILEHKGAWMTVPKPEVLRSVIYHRLGVVPVGEASIVIAVCSAHRKEAFIECEWILEEIKKKAQIWKCEFYEGSSQWKEN